MFGIMIDEASVKNAYEKATANNTIDFGLLNEPFQKQIISTILSNRTNRTRLIRLNTFLTNPGDVSNRDDLIRNNMEAVLLNYNKQRYKENLMDTYAKVIRNGVRQKIDKKTLLSEFLTLKNFSLLKWCDYDET